MAEFRETNMKGHATLILAPHVDDEVLGCHSLLSADVKVIFFGVEDRSNISAAERLAELKRVAARCLFNWTILDFPVNRYQSADLIGPIEQSINKHKPRRVLLPYPSYNQDHRAVYDAGLTATRPHDLNWFVREVLAYEELQVQLWPHGPLMEPNYFVPLDIEEKLETYRMYRSQVRGHRSPDLLEALARLPGAQANVRFAEGFLCLRWVADGGAE